MTTVRFKQVGVFTRVPFAGHPTIGRVSIRVEKGEIFLGGHAVTCVEGSLRLD